GADGGGPRGGGASESGAVSRLDAPDAEADGGTAPRGRDPARLPQIARAGADGALSAAALPGGADARVPARRAHLEDRGPRGPLSRRVAVHGLVQPAAESRDDRARAADVSG